LYLLPSPAMARHFRTPRLRNWTQLLGSIRRLRIEAKRLRGAKQVAIIAKAVRLVLRNRMRPGSFATYAWRWYARIQIFAGSTHSVADHHAGAERVEARAATLRASYRGAGPRATDCTGCSGSAAGVLDYRSAASVAPTPRVFRCTCGAPGTWTEWAGVVSSSNFLLASQSARGQCANFLLNQNAPSPFIVPEGTTASNQHQQIFNGTAFTQRAQVATSVGQNVQLPRSSVTQLTTECSRCACN
jgi:hypothetical protein